MSQFPKFPVFGDILKLKADSVWIRVFKKARQAEAFFSLLQVSKEFEIFSIAVNLIQTGTVKRFLKKSKNSVKIRLVVQISPFFN